VILESYFPLSIDLQMLIPPIVSFMLSCLLVPLVIYYSKKFHVFDLPIGGHKTHSQPIPNLGGVAIAFSTGATFIVASKLLFGTNEFFLSGSFAITTLAGIVILGLLDDLRPRSAAFRLLIQTAIVFLGVSAINQVVPTNIQLLDNQFLNQLITIFFVLSVCNFVNMIDNHDGSASGISLLILIQISLVASLSGQKLILLMALCASASTLAFLIWNFPPAKIYLGDSGSTFLGTLISLLLIQLDFQDSTPHVATLFILMTLGILELDFLIAVTSRIRRGLSPMKGDQSHIAHRLMRMNFAKYQVTFIIWTITIWFLTLANITLLYEIVPLNVIFSLMGVSFILLFVYFMKKADA
jgi:UDP-GlcNAc:undecaprenyl-phosphate GlcNAc-1-phosphate transferase